MLAEGRYLWNAGIFLFSVKTILAAFDTHAPNMAEPVRSAIAEGLSDLGFFRLAPDLWDGLEDISIDYAVMERVINLSVVTFGGGWSDLGGWDAVWRESGSDGSGVALSGQATAIDCTDTLLRSEDDGLEIVGIGLDVIIAVAMPDAVLVADKSGARTSRRRWPAPSPKRPSRQRPFQRIIGPGVGSKAWSSGTVFRSSA